MRSVSARRYILRINVRCIAARSGSHSTPQLIACRQLAPRSLFAPRQPLRFAASTVAVSPLPHCRQRRIPTHLCRLCTPRSLLHSHHARPFATPIAAAAASCIAPTQPRHLPFASTAFSRLRPLLHSPLAVCSAGRFAAIRRTPATPHSPCRRRRHSLPFQPLRIPQSILHRLSLLQPHSATATGARLPQPATICSAITPTIPAGRLAVRVHNSYPFNSQDHQPTPLFSCCSIFSLGWHHSHRRIFDYSAQPVALSGAAKSAG